jgi:ParB-like chromosome segregation protein Spo0J
MAETVTVEIEKLTPHPDNPRRGDVPAIMRSLEKFGQVKPIIVQRSTGYVVAGNHTMEAAKRLGWTTVQVQIVDMDDETARAYLIADNRTSDRGTYDKNVLYRTLQSALGSLEDTGWSQEDLELLGEDISEGTQKRRKKIEIEAKESRDDVQDPVREVVLMFTAEQLDELAGQVADLQQVWDASTLVEIVRRAVSEAHDRWQAGINSKRGSDKVLPIQMAETDF